MKTIKLTNKYLKTKEGKIGIVLIGTMLFLWGYLTTGSIIVGLLFATAFNYFGAWVVTYLTSRKESTGNQT